MPAKCLIVENKADKELSRLPTRIQIKIIHGLDLIKENPMRGAKLQGELGNYYKYRVGDYRILYLFDSKQSLLIVFKIEHRQGVYK